MTISISFEIGPKFERALDHFGISLKTINQKLDSIMATEAELAASLKEVKDNLVEASSEFDAKLTELTTALANQGQTTPEVDQLVQDLKDMSGALKDKVPNP